MDLGSKLRFLRDRMGIRQSEIANSLGIAVSTYSQYENNIRQPNYDMLLDISAYYRVSVNFLLTDDPFDPDEEIEILIHSEQKYIEVQYIFQMYYDSLIKVNAIIEDIDSNCTTTDDDALLIFYLSKLEDISNEMNGYKNKINDLIVFDDIDEKIIKYLKLKK